ncbi:MAG TPA: beta-ketoacyl synthase N-terminal-like domain-containing protein [Gammaproteobacteria bacterium]|nr:beta-ketoacyl synthase N-terminal-like domain-containing protein [Gammaproteobacteria bacterium]
MIRVISASHYLQPVADDAGLPPLAAILKPLCRESFRRIDRFIQLALLGSARCAAAQTLQPDCGIYLGSGLGPIGNNAVIQEHLIHDHEIPKPFNFINTLGSAAGYNVARNLDLHGQNLFVSRRGASLQAVLSMAMADLTLGIVSQALVGVVEEVALPLAHHRRRQTLAADVLLAEGSDWLLLQSAADGPRRLQVERFAEFAALRESLESAWHDGDSLHYAGSMERRMADTLQQDFDGNPPLDLRAGFHDSLEAARFAGFVAGAEPGDLFLADGNAERGWSLFHLGA